MNSILVIFVLGLQGHPPLTKNAANLDPSTKPLLTIPFLNGKACVTVDETPPSADQGAFWMRIFRYTYKGDFRALKKNWKSTFKPKEGWEHVPEGETQNQFIVERLVRHPIVRRQAFIVSAHKLIFDRNAPAMTRQVAVPGWIRLSFNEEYLRRPPKAKALKR